MNARTLDLQFSPRVTPRCPDHPSERTGWYCDACKRPLCGQCTATEVNLFYCGHCEGVARQLIAPRATIPFSTILGDALAYPFRKRFVLLLVLAAALTGLSTFGTWMESERIETSSTASEKAPSDALDTTATASTATRPDDKARDGAAAASATPEISRTPKGPPLLVALLHALRAMLIAVGLLYVVHARADGEESDDAEGWATGALQGVGATLIAWLPGVAYAVFLFVYRASAGATLLTDWLLWLYAALVVAYVPIAFAVTATGVPLDRAFNPFALSDCAWRVRGRYVATLSILVVLLGVGVGLGAVLPSAGTNALEIDAAIAFAVHIVVVALAFQAAHLIGSLSFVYGYEFGWGTVRDFCDPVLPGVPPTATLKRWATRLAANSAGDALDEARIAREVVSSLKLDNGARALRYYEGRPTWSEGSFSDEELFNLGNAARTARKSDLAERLLQSIADKPSVLGSRALQALGKLYENDKKDLAKAAESYRRLLERFPGTDAAKFASQRLAVLGDAGAGKT